VTALPFTVSATADMAFLLEIGPKALFFAPTGEADGRTGQNRVDLDFLCSSRVFRWQPYRGALIGNKRRFSAAAKPSVRPHAPRLGRALISGRLCRASDD